MLLDVLSVYFADEINAFAFGRLKGIASQTLILNTELNYDHNRIANTKWFVFIFFFNENFWKKRCITTEQNRTSQSYSDKSLPLFIINTTGFFVAFVAAAIAFVAGVVVAVIAPTADVCVWVLLLLLRLCRCLFILCCILVRSYIYRLCWASVVVYEIGARVHRGRQACKQTRGNILAHICAVHTESVIQMQSSLMHSS